MSPEQRKDLSVAEGDGGSSPLAMPKPLEKTPMDDLDDILSRTPSVSDQIAMYRAGRFDVLARSADWGLAYFMEPESETPVWQVRLLSLDVDERERIKTVCGIIERADGDDRSALSGTLRDSIVKNGVEPFALGAVDKIPAILVRFAVFFMVERFRCGGLSRQEAIDCVLHLCHEDLHFKFPSSETISDWYDKKSGVAYTGVKQFAELIAYKPSRYVVPLWAIAIRALRANLDIIRRLADLGILSDTEKANVKGTARWLLRLLKIFNKIFGEDSRADNRRRIERRLASLDSDRIIDDVVPLLLQGKS